jgi:LAO/AO transport system kinase
VIAVDDLVASLLDGDQRALARAISVVENRREGYRDLVGELHEHARASPVLGVTGPPGAGKSTLVDRIVQAHREAGRTVGVIAIDPSSPYSGGAVLGDRIRIAAADEGVFIRSMSTRGSLGGLATATADAITALDAFGFDRIVVETVGAGQSEIEVVRTADTVAVLVPPGGGDDVQMLKAGILEIADVFVVNKADLAGAERTVSRLRQMLGERGEGAGDATDGDGSAAGYPTWEPPIVDTVATDGEGVPALLTAIEDHLAHLEATGERAVRRRERQADTIRRILRAETRAFATDRLAAHGGVDALADRVLAGETDPYTAAMDVLAPIEDRLEEE